MGVTGSPGWPKRPVLDPAWPVAEAKQVIRHYSRSYRAQLTEAVRRQHDESRNQLVLDALADFAARNGRPAVVAAYCAAGHEPAAPSLRSSTLTTPHRLKALRALTCSSREGTADLLTQLADAATVSSDEAASCGSPEAFGQAGQVLLPVLSDAAGSELATPDWAWWPPGDPLLVAAHNILQPAGTRLGPAALGMADIILVPALAAGLDGSRIGQGAGWYDRALGYARPGAERWVLVNEAEVWPALPSAGLSTGEAGLTEPSEGSLPWAGDQAVQRIFTELRSRHC